MNKALAVVFLGVSTALLAAGAIYALRPANSLPSFMPGYNRTLQRVHYTHAAASFGAGIVLALLAWRVSRPKRSQTFRDRLVTRSVASGRGRSERYLLEVRGRKTGHFHSTPVDVLVHTDKLYVVSRQGNTSWSRNVHACGVVTLIKGKTRERFEARSIDDTDKPGILKAYRDRFSKTARKYLPVQAGSPAGDFVVVAEHYPVFELVPLTEKAPQIARP